MNPKFKVEIPKGTSDEAALDLLLEKIAAMVSSGHLVGEAKDILLDYDVDSKKGVIDVELDKNLVKKQFRTFTATDVVQISSNEEKRYSHRENLDEFFSMMETSLDLSNEDFNLLRERFSVEDAKYDEDTTENCYMAMIDSLKFLELPHDQRVIKEAIDRYHSETMTYSSTDMCWKITNGREPATYHKGSVEEFEKHKEQASDSDAKRSGFYVTEIECEEYDAEMKNFSVKNILGKAFSKLDPKAKVEMLCEELADDSLSEEQKNVCLSELEELSGTRDLSLGVDELVTMCETKTYSREVTIPLHIYPDTKESESVVTLNKDNKIIALNILESESEVDPGWKIGQVLSIKELREFLGENYYKYFTKTYSGSGNGFDYRTAIPTSIAENVIKDAGMNINDFPRSGYSDNFEGELNGCEFMIYSSSGDFRLEAYSARDAEKILKSYGSTGYMRNFAKTQDLSYFRGLERKILSISNSLAEKDYMKFMMSLESRYGDSIAEIIDRRTSADKLHYEQREYDEKELESILDEIMDENDIKLDDKVKLSSSVNLLGKEFSNSNKDAMKLTEHIELLSEDSLFENNISDIDGMVDKLCALKSEKGLEKIVSDHMTGDPKGESSMVSAIRDFLQFEMKLFSGRLSSDTSVYRGVTLGNLMEACDENLYEGYSKEEAKKICEDELGPYSDQLEDSHLDWIVENAGNTRMYSDADSREYSRRNPQSMSDQILDTIESHLEAGQIDEAIEEYNSTYKDELSSDQVSKLHKLFEDSKVSLSKLSLMSASEPALETIEDARAAVHVRMEAAHSDNYSAEVTDEVLDGIVADNADIEPGELYGRATSGLGMSKTFSSSNDINKSYEDFHAGNPDESAISAVESLMSKFESAHNLPEGSDQDVIMSNLSEEECTELRSLLEPTKTFSKPNPQHLADMIEANLIAEECCEEPEVIVEDGVVKVSVTTKDKKMANKVINDACKSFGGCSVGNAYGDSNVLKIDLKLNSMVKFSMNTDYSEAEIVEIETQLADLQNDMGEESSQDQRKRCKELENKLHHMKVNNFSGVRAFSKNGRSKKYAATVDIPMQSVNIYCGTSEEIDGYEKSFSDSDLKIHCSTNKATLMSDMKKEYPDYEIVAKNFSNAENVEARDESNGTYSILINSDLTDGWRVYKSNLPFHDACTEYDNACAISHVKETKIVQGEVLNENEVFSTPSDAGLVLAKTSPEIESKTKNFNTEIHTKKFSSIDSHKNFSIKSIKKFSITK